MSPALASAPDPRTGAAAVFEVSGPPAWRTELPHTTAAVPIARALVRTALTEIEGPEQAAADRDTAELLTAELVANAVQHTPGDSPIELVVELLPAPGGCQIEVHDDRPAGPDDLPCPDPAIPVDPWQEHGRGMLLIRALSSDCGHRPTAHGKAVWFTLPAVPLPAGPRL